MESWELDGFLTKSAYEANRMSTTTYNDEQSFLHSINSEKALNYNFNT